MATAGFSAPACTGCGLVYESTKVSFPPAEDAPRWYQQFARKVDPLNIPEYWDINEAALLAGWSDKVSRAGRADLYEAFMLPSGLLTL